MHDVNTNIASHINNLFLFAFIVIACLKFSAALSMLHLNKAVKGLLGTLSVESGPRCPSLNARTTAHR